MREEQMEAAARKLLKAAWSTKSSRFTAHRRMSSMHAWSLGSIAIVSVYVVGVALLPLVLELEAAQVQWLSMITILSAVGILALSLLEAGRSYEARGERLHESGLKLGAFCGELDAFIAEGCSGGGDALRTLRERYDDILRDQKENHHLLDYRKFVAENRAEFEVSWLEARWVEAKWYVWVYWKFLAVILTPPAAVWWIVG